MLVHSISGSSSSYTHEMSRGRDMTAGARSASELPWRTLTSASVMSDIVFRDAQAMFHNRHVWKNLIAMLEQNSTLQDTAIVKNRIIRTYVTTQWPAVRRLNDKRAKTISLRRCLGELISDPKLVMRSRYERFARVGAAARGTEDLLDRVFAGYDEFADTFRDQLDVGTLRNDLAELDNASTSVKTRAPR